MPPPSGANPGSGPLPGRRERLAVRAHGLGLLPILKSVRGLVRHDLRVLAYHRVRDIDAGFRFDTALVSAEPEAFAEQMRHVRDHYHPVSCDEVVAALDAGASLPRGAVLVTFDDGYDDNYQIAFPILRELGVPAIFFVSTGHIDSGAPYVYDWLVHMIRIAPPGRCLSVPEIGFQASLSDDAGSRIEMAASLLDRLKVLDAMAQQDVIGRVQRDWDLPPPAHHADCRPMTWDQLRAMRDGGMTIGAHGVDHLMLAKLPVERMNHEIRHGKARIDAELGVDTLAISYPVGGPDAYDDQVKAVVRDAGFRLGFTYLSGCNPWPPGDPYTLRRMPVETCLGTAWFAGALAVPEVFCHPSVVRAQPE